MLVAEIERLNNKLEVYQKAFWKSNSYVEKLLAEKKEHDMNKQQVEDIKKRI